MSKTSLSGSRRSSKMRDDSELYLECKAAFLTEFDDIEEKIESKSKLISLLQLTGRNPTRLALTKYWTSGTRTLSFSDFVEICNKEPITNADDLMKAFRKIDINGDGYISLDELYKIMNQKGENMSRDDVRKMIDEVDENKDGRLDYKEFTQMVLQTAEKSKQMSRKVMERKERKKKRGELSAKQSGPVESVDLNHANTTIKINKEKYEESSKVDREFLDKSDNVEESVLGNELDNTSNTKIGSTASFRSIRSNKGELVSSIRRATQAEKQGSTVSLEKQNYDNVKGSNASLGFDKQEEITDENMRASKETLKDIGNDSALSKPSARESKLGSKSSLRSETNLKVEADLSASRHLLKEMKEDVKASKASIKSEVRDSKLGSRASLRSQTKVNVEHDVNTSNTTLKEADDDVASSKVSLKASAKGSELGSKVSLKEKKGGQGSQVSLKSNVKENFEAGNEAPKRRESTSSQHSQASKQDEIVQQSLTTESSKAILSSKSETGSSLYPDLGIHSDKPSTPTKSKQNVKSEKSNSQKNFNGQISNKPLSAKHVEFEQIRTPRSKFGIPTITQMERPGTSYRTDSDDNLDMNEAEIKNADLFKMASYAKKDSARSVKEEIQLDDDEDIVSTGRSTPRVSLGSRRDTPKTESVRSTKQDHDGQKKDEKGNLLDVSATKEASLSTKHEKYTNITGVGKDIDKEKLNVNESLLAESINDPDQDTIVRRMKSDDNSKQEVQKDLSKSSKKGKEKASDDNQRKENDDYKVRDINNKAASLQDKDKDSNENVGSLNMMDIYSQGQRNYIVHRQEVLDGVEKPNLSVSQIEKKPPTGKDITNQGASRKEEERNAETEARLYKSAKMNDNDLGSQTSLRSGDKEVGVPVPSPRKSVTQSVTKEDDLPRPSPRVRTSKTKSPSSSLRSKDKLPDARSLQDWFHTTSKGCFFYEDEEIVSHVYSLKLQDDSTVYLSAEPISEPSCLNLPGSEPIDTALYVFDRSGKVVSFTEQRDVQGTYGVKVDLAAGEYQILPYTTGCRFKQRGEMSSSPQEAKLVKKDKHDKIHITTPFRDALKNIFILCDLDGNGTMSKDEFNWFNVRTSGEELGDEEWEVVEEKTTLRDGEITLEGFIELNELEAEDAEGDVEDLWITLTSMGMNKSLKMDEACPYKVNVYVKDVGRKKPSLKVTGIESLEKREFVSEICQSLIEKSQGPISIRKMKDLFLYTYKNDYRATMVIDNRSRSTVMLEIDCSKSRNVISNRSGLDHTFEIDPQQTAIAHHLMPKSELSDWTVESTQSIQK